MSARLVVGIDLGTTHTVVASAEIGEGAEPEIFRIPQYVSRSESETRPLLPSFLYAPLSGEVPEDPWGDAPWVLGAYARERGGEVPGRLISSAKSWLSHAAVDRHAPILPYGAADDARDLHRISPVEASARILRHVRAAWDLAHPRQVLAEQQVILTVPASFDQAARELTLAAARDAGLTVRLLEEPQAAFYAYMHRAGEDALGAILLEAERSLVLVCDVGGGTTDLSLISIARSGDGAVDVSRVAVGRHLLLGGDNIDLALAHLCEPRLVDGGKKLDSQRFAQLVLACRSAKEQLLGAAAPEQVPIRILSTGSSLVGGTLATEVTRAEVESLVIDGFLPLAAADARPKRGRSGLVAFGLPYEHDPAITKHLAAFFSTHAPRDPTGGPTITAPHAVLFNGGLFHAEPAAGRITEVLRGWGGRQPRVLDGADPDLAVAHGAVVYGLALAGYGVRIGGGTAHGYYVGIEAKRQPGSGRPRAVCVVPRGAKEGERHSAKSKRLALTVGRPVRFELYASDDPAVHAPGEIVTIAEDAPFELLPPVAATLDGGDDENLVPVVLEGELTAVGTVDLACVEVDVPEGREPRRFALAFELRGAETEVTAAWQPTMPPKASILPPASVAPASSRGKRFDDAVEAIQRVFGKGRKDVKDRESRDLLRELERLLGERRAWDTELCRSLFDVIGPKSKARRRSADHERMYWLITGFCLRPGFGHPLDPGRVKLVAPLFEQGLAHSGETRGWEMFFIAWRRVAGGLDEERQVAMRKLVDPFLATEDQQKKKPKGFKPQPVRQMLEMASWLERVPPKQRVQLGGWLLDRTWTDRNPQLWEAIGRLGARVPAYASVHHVVSPQAVERWLDHLLREKWEDLPTAARAATMLVRMTGDRARDVSEAVRKEVARRLEQVEARPEWIQSVKEVVEVESTELAELFGEELPRGLALLPE